MGLEKINLDIEMNFMNFQFSISILDFFIDFSCLIFSS
jgi:hypothetical protein